MEEPVTFFKEDKKLYGILHTPNKTGSLNIVVIIVIGGPQIRIGSHRLHIQLSRFLCSHGISVLRFDYEGMGDSFGDFVEFEGIAPSIDAAINFISQHYSNHSEIILWSICNGSSACAIYASSNSNKISGLILCNPFGFSDEKDISKSVLKYYYLKRLFKIEFWKKLLLLNMDFKLSYTDFFDYIKKATPSIRGLLSDQVSNMQNILLADRVVRGIIKCKKPVDIILSTDDIVAMGFRDLLENRKKIKQLIVQKKIFQIIIKGADHTFTDPESKKELFKVTLNSVNKIASKP